MSASKIEWTEETWNPIAGCSVHTPGCTNCYAMKMAARLEAVSIAHETKHGGDPGQLAHYRGLTQPSKAGPVWTGKIGIAPDSTLTKPLRWKKPRRIFVNSMSDLFHPDVPWEVIARVIAVCLLTPHHTYQILTKRADRMRAWFETLESERGSDAFCEIVEEVAELIGREVDGTDWTLPLPNVWLGVSVEDQTRADQRIPDLLATPAAVRWISAEPLLGPVDLTSLDIRGEYEMNALKPHTWQEHLEDWRDSDDDWVEQYHEEFGHEPGSRTGPAHARIDWVVCGGESGKNARPMHPDWARFLRDQCAAAGVPFFFKQWGEWAPPDAFGATSYGPVTRANGGGGNWRRQYVVCGDNRADRLNAHSFTDHATNLVFQVGKKRAGRLLDGVLHDGFPA